MKAAILALSLFLVVSLAGIATGWAIFLGDSSPWVENFLYSLSAGTLLYLGIVEVLLRAHKSRHEDITPAFTAIGCLFVVTGFSLMFVLTLWA